MEDEGNRLIERSAERKKTIVYRVESTGPFGYFAGLIVACLVAGALAAIFILGFITLTVVIWIGFGFALLAVVAAVLRRAFGRRPGA